MKPKILIIDDEPMNLEYIVSIFEEIRESYDIYQSNDGLHAFEVIEKTDPDLVITDWNMPNSGLDLVKKMRSHQSYKDIPVLVYSGILNSTEHLITALNAGATDYINKPINPMELIARSHSMLKLSQSYKNIKSLNKSKDLLLNIIANDLQGSIGNMQNVLDILSNQEHAHQNSHNPAVLNHASTQAKKSYHLLDNLLNWIKVQLGNLNANPVNFNIYELTENILLEYNTQNVSIKQFCSNISQVFADKQMMEIIIRNLIDNALRYVTDTGFINISCEQLISENQLKLTISDNGSGISPQHLADILNTQKPILQYNNQGEIIYGLGLKLVQELIELNHGSLSINSSLNIGTSVCITMPTIAYSTN